VSAALFSDCKSTRRIYWQFNPFNPTSKLSDSLTSPSAPLNLAVAAVQLVKVSV